MGSFRRQLHATHRQVLHLLGPLERLVGGSGGVLLVLGAATGVVAGLSAVAFVLLVRLVNSLVWTWSVSLQDVVPGDGLGLEGAPAIVPDGYVIAAVAAGMVIVVLVVRKLAPEAGGHGVPEVMESVAQRGGLMRGRVGVVKLIASSLNIGFGGSVGKEGPIVQVGAAFGSAIGRLFAVHGRPMRTLAGCGAAAGIAAVFNAPIGGVMFALEIIVGAYNLASFAPVQNASLAGAVTARRLLSADPAFAIPEALKRGLTLVSPWEMGAYVVMGLIFGVASVGFIRMLYLVDDGAAAWHVPAWVKAALAGALVGLAGLFLPQVLGEGHHLMSRVLVADAKTLPWLLLLTLGVVKTLTTSLTLGGGGSGGVFTPSLFVGAMLGGCYGQLLAMIFPGHVAGFGAYALVGMAALLAGTAHAPMTGILLMFEMTDNYLLILPLMTASVLATAVAARLMPYSIYSLKLSRKGVILRDKEDTALLRRLRVWDAMQPPVDAIPETTTFDRIVRRLLQSDGHDFPVIDADGRLTGAISLDDVREFLREEALDHLLLARDCVHTVATLAPHATLLDALEVFERHTTYDVPVVSNGRLIGSLRRADVLRTYRRALLAQARQPAEA